MKREKRVVLNPAFSLVFSVPLWLVLLFETKAMNPWAEYAPTAANPWDRRKAGHLLRRAGFGATAGQLDRAVADGPKATIDRLLTGGDADADFDATSKFMATEASLPASSPGTRATN